jgi:hypothetical protein
MTYKTVTVRKVISIGNIPHVQDVEDIEPYLNEGYTVVNASSTHVWKNEVASGAVMDIPTSVFIITSYFLSKDGN